MSERTLRAVIEGRRLITASEDTCVRDAASLMVEHRIGALAVVRGTRLVGIFTERDVLARVLLAGRDPERTVLREVMTPEPLTIDIDQSLRRALHLMQNHDIRHLPVEEGGVPVGMVSTRDALGEEWVRFEAEREMENVVSSLLR